MYQTPDGTWHGSVNFGLGPDGKRLRRHVRGKTQGEVKKKLDQLRKRRDVGAGITAMRNPTVGDWTKAWIEIVERTRRPSTAKTYRTHIKYLDPLAGVRLDRFTSEHVESVYMSLLDRGVAPLTVQGVHRTYRSCFGEAVKRCWLTRNPVTAARPGTAEDREVVPLNLDEAQAILGAASGRRNAAKWGIALGLGLRQGEVLGLQWDDIDLDASTLRVRRALRQGRWRHGCKHPERCLKRAQNCPQRHGGGLIAGPPKSRKGIRTIVLPEPLKAALKAHRSAQAGERLAAGELWQPAPPRGDLHSGTGWVFTSPVGKPIDPRRDWEEWKTLLNLAGVRDARLHDARHTAATFLLVAGVDTRTVMDLLGWSHSSLTVRYQHVVDELKNEAVRRMEALLWGPNPAVESG
jgi:integrase